MRSIVLVSTFVLGMLSNYSSGSAEEIKICDPKVSLTKLVKCLNENISILNLKLADKIDSKASLIIRNKNEGDCLVVVNHVLTTNTACAENDVQYRFGFQ